MATREELEARLREREEKREADRAAQAELDELAVLEAKLADEDGTGISVIRLQRYAPGLPTLVIVRKPGSAEYKRFRDLTLRGERAKALGYLHGDCLSYPDVKTFAAMTAVFPELPDQVAVVGIALAKGGAEEEGKG